jgi:16S rRNA (uracil1498-N3)-methyltransferase
VPARFHVPDAAAGRQVVLPPDEARHLVRVLRLGPGDRIGVFDGRGREFLATVETVSPAVTATVGATVEPAPEPTIHWSLAPALLKGDRMDRCVRDATMAGVGRIQPLMTARTVVSWPAAGRPAALARWRRVAISSAKQCGRAVLPEIDAPLPFETLLTTPSDGRRILLVEPAAAGSAVRAADLATQPAPAACLLAAGPEGGWDATEIAAAAAAGFELVTLGRRVLRADAVPLVALAVFQAIWRDL